MDDFKEQYDNNSKSLQHAAEELKRLKENRYVFRYLALINIIEELQSKQADLYRDMKLAEYEACQHILVCSGTGYNSLKGKYFEYRCCVKCGLDNRVLADYRDFIFPYSQERYLMYSYLQEHYFYGTETAIRCDAKLAQAVYSKIRENNPNISDEIAIKYLEAALHGIRSVKVSNAREISRAKRLSLSPDFKRWSADEYF